MIGDPVDVRAWQRAISACTALSVTEFYATGKTVTITVRAAASAHAIPVTLVAVVSPRWHDVFEFTVAPALTGCGYASMDRCVEILTEHATRLAYRASVDRMHTQKGRP